MRKTDKQRLENILSKVQEHDLQQARRFAHSIWTDELPFFLLKRADEMFNKKSKKEGMQEVQEILGLAYLILYYEMQEIPCGPRSFDFSLIPPEPPASSPERSG